MIERRFEAGQTFTIGQLQYRIERGDKHPDDLRLDWRYCGDWQPVVLDHVALIVDMIADNENILYPPPAAGGDYVRRYVIKALREGWRAAVVELHTQRARKADRSELGRCS